MYLSLFHFFQLKNFKKYVTERMIENIIIYNFYMKSILYKLLYESKTWDRRAFQFFIFYKDLRRFGGRSNQL